MSVLAWAQDLIYPALCPVCRTRQASAAAGVCRLCEAQLPRLAPPFCPGCGGTLDGVLARCSECLRLPRPWQQAVSVFEFGGLARQAIHQFKYRRDVALTEFLARSVFHNWEAGEVALNADLVTSVPLHWFRHLRRGYNQSELFGRRFAQLAGLPYQEVLVRHRWTTPQAQLSLQARRLNPRNAFRACAALEIKQKRVLLCDDVLTTGSTLGVCAEILLAAGAGSVVVMTLARG